MALAKDFKGKVLGNNILVVEMGSVQLSAEHRQESVFLEVLQVGGACKEKISVGDIVQKRRDVMQGMKYDGLSYPPTQVEDPTPFFISEGQILYVFNKMDKDAIKAALGSAEVELRRRFAEDMQNHSLKKVEDSGEQLQLSEEEIQQLHKAGTNDMPN